MSNNDSANMSNDNQQQQTTEQQQQPEQQQEAEIRGLQAANRALVAENVTFREEIYGLLHGEQPAETANRALEAENRLEIRNRALEDRVQGVQQRLEDERTGFWIIVRGLERRSQGLQDQVRRRDERDRLVAELREMMAVLVRAEQAEQQAGGVEMDADAPGEAGEAPAEREGDGPVGGAANDLELDEHEAAAIAQALETVATMFGNHNRLR
ncbi:uncharacterized protein K452DRAFT_298275 [Aplosporella prunicola CBS 121167]|uniref:Uncharacterized protein n=1 Tax=Aplosporella prunicola CBS 121167 TaxID=1176127 RepID=A0A6A6BF83_9PEZI|nr:uncharacterized protein K452DRAFT_298275 [Aplosporella prunicola CBS 121167]KAF2141567.1 hypothetical protein K452DRAFT_298275 [Aplosporella prunicola CBS 121167]